jgi:HSP20 family protein
MATSTTDTMTTAAQAARETGPAALTVAPRVDIYETDTAYVLLADMPGVMPDGLDVLAEPHSLVIRGRVDHPAITPEYQEFTLGDYHRTFTLTEDLDTDRMTATLRDGVLRVDIPKSARVQPKKIPVRAD